MPAQIFLGQNTAFLSLNHLTLAVYNFSALENRLAMTQKLEVGSFI